MRYLKVKIGEYNLEYNISLKNRVSFLVGDSATGKSRLVDFISKYNRSLDINVSIDIELTSDFESVIVVNNKAQLLAIPKLHNSLILVDELSMSLILSDPSIVEKSNNFFIFMYRDVISNITTGVKGVLKLSSIKKDGITVNYIECIYSFNECSENTRYAK